MAEMASAPDSTGSVLRQDILLTTKLHVPLVRPNLVARPRLVELVDRGSSTRLTLISAPAGSGKTTLLAEWIAARKPSVAWLSLDKGDNDQTRFWSYVILALQGIHDELGESALAALRSPQRQAVEAIPAILVDEISGLPITDYPFVLIFDDYHVTVLWRIFATCTLTSCSAHPASRRSRPADGKMAFANR
jgi:ATP/maltotriose-dependent transcriptional regulator MalT